MKDYFAKQSISEFTRDEFLDFVRTISEVPWNTEAETSLWIRHFDKLVAPHPRKNGLLFYPESGKESDEAVVAEVERYRRENGLSGFKNPDA